MPPDDPSPDGKSPDRRASRPGPAVLLVEAEAPLRALLRRIVESAGYEALEARSSGEALELLSAEARSVRLVLADLAESGVAGAQGLRRHIPRGAKLLLLSTANYERPEVRALEDGVAFYLSNPFRADVLAAKIRDLLEER
jgi:two-component system cell cycle sensor histidine kinase/response regulator CckA